MPSDRFVPRAVLALALVMSLQGCAPSKSATPKPRTPRPLLVIGDSIVVGARDFGGIVARLQRDAWQADVVAEIGRTTEWALARIRDRRIPSVVVVGLGSNPGPRATGFRKQVDTLRIALIARGAQRIVWIPPVDRDALRYSARVRILRGFATKKIIVPDWGSELGAHPEWFAPDGLHLTGDGYRALASFVAETLAAF